MSEYSYDRTAATRREKLEKEIAGQRKMIDYMRSLKRPPEMEADFIARHEAEIARLEARLSKLPPEKPKVVPFKFEKQLASEDTECFECAKPIDQGKPEWFEVSDPEGSLGPFCTRRCAQLLATQRRKELADQGL